MGEIMPCEFCKLNKKCIYKDLKKRSYGFCIFFEITFIGWLYYKTIGRKKKTMSERRYKCLHT